MLSETRENLNCFLFSWILTQTNVSTIPIPCISRQNLQRLFSCTKLFDPFERDYRMNWVVCTLRTKWIETKGILYCVLVGLQINSFVWVFISFFFYFFFTFIGITSNLCLSGFILTKICILILLVASWYNVGVRFKAWVRVQHIHLGWKFICGLQA